MTRRRWIIAAAALLLVIAIVTAVGVVRGSGGGGSGQEAAESGQKWHCPMHPDYVADAPGSCPICGMDLVPIEEGKTESGDEELAETVSGLSTVHLDEAKRQLIGVTTAPVMYRKLGEDIDTVGIIKPDETRLRTINARIGGWIERLYVDFEGDTISRGELMLSIYSPEFVQAQEEYLAALEAQKNLSSSSIAQVRETGHSLLRGALRRMELWNIPQSAISRLRRTGTVTRTVDLHAPFSGVVMKRMVATGAKISPGQPLFTVSDLSSVWVEADIYEKDLHRVSEGQSALITLDAYPETDWLGTVEHTYPYVDGDSRTMKGRISLKNSDGRLKPQMYAHVTIAGPVSRKLVVPSSAVVDTGERHLVYVQRQEGVYEPREIEAGTDSNGYTAVLSGLDEGDRVVKRGLFMIDSESRLHATISDS